MTADTSWAGEGTLVRGTAPAIWRWDSVSSAMRSVRFLDLIVSLARAAR